MTRGAPGWTLTDLVAWQVAIDFAEAVHHVTKGFPPEENYELRRQLRRAANSVASNIAEGHGRSSRREFARFARSAQGSLKEAETQLRLAGRFGYVTPAGLEPPLQLADRLNRLLTALRRALVGEQRR